jgi:hypothetical protein
MNPERTNPTLDPDGLNNGDSPWIPALVTGLFFTVYGIAKFDEWRDRRALAKRDDEVDSQNSPQSLQKPPLQAGVVAQQVTKWTAGPTVA